MNALKFSRTILFAALAFSITHLGCGDDAPSSKTDKTAANNSTANNTAANNTSGGGVVVEASCPAGVCSCPTGLVLCGNLCVDASKNTDHCGSCDTSCQGDASICVSGQCACGAGAVQCGNTCADLSTDANHCGDCGNDCNNNETCVSGVCEALMCGPGLVACRNDCVDLSIDAAHCGACGDACFGGETCQSGQCICAAGSACALVGNEGTVVGGACDTNTVCDAGSTCLGGQDFPGGTCSKTCLTSADCPGATECISVNGEGSCLLACDQNDQCRQNYECRRRDLMGGGGEARICMAN